MLSDQKVILVTGGAGFIGSHLVDNLLETDFDQVLVVDNFFLGNLDNLDSKKDNDSKLSIIRIDASDQFSMASVINKFNVTTVVNLAIVPLPTSLEFPMWTFQENLKITMTLLELLRIKSYKNLIQISSSEVYGTANYTPMDEKHPGKAPTPYAASKYASDVVIQSYIDTFQVNATIVRPFNNFGPRQNSKSYAGIIPIVIKNVIENKPIEIFGDGNQSRDFIYVEDTAKGIIDIIYNQNCQGEIINLATGVETTMNTLVSFILDVMNAPNHEIIYKESRPGDVVRHCADISKFIRFFNYKPQAINKINIEKTITWYLEKFK